MCVCIFIDGAASCTHLHYTFTQSLSCAVADSSRGAILRMFWKRYKKSSLRLHNYFLLYSVKTIWCTYIATSLLMLCMTYNWFRLLLIVEEATIVDVTGNFAVGLRGWGHSRDKDVGVGRWNQRNHWSALCNRVRMHAICIYYRTGLGFPIYATLLWFTNF